MKETWGQAQAIDFAIHSALEAIDQTTAYGSLQESVASHHQNVRDTLVEYAAEKHETAALAAYYITLNKGNKVWNS